MSVTLELEETFGAESVERIARLSREEVDALPYGLMMFDHAGTVHLYNRYESELSRRKPAAVVGRSWFREVAPCTRVAAFEGRFRAFVERADSAEILRFDFRFHFLHGAQDVEVTFAHAPEPNRVMVIVTRRALGEGGRRLDVTEPVAVRAEDGRVRGGLGGALAAPRAFFSALADDSAAFDKAAATWGRALLDGIEEYCERVHQRPLTALPALLATATIDEAFAAQGLGRLELDFGGGARGVLGFAVRAVDLPVELATRLYTAILRELARGLSGRSLEVVLFAHHGEIMRFAATTPHKAATIQRWSTELQNGREIAKKTGLEVWT